MSTSSNNPLLASIQIPGETFRLPSMGLFYNNGELAEDVTDGEVHVHPMRTIDELVFKSPDKLFTGKAVQDVFGRCIEDIKSPMALLAKDVDYLMTCLRIVTYGDILEVAYNHKCGTEEKPAKDHKYQINLRELVRHARTIDPTSLKNFSVTVSTGQVVNLQPPRFGNVIKIFQTSDNAEQLTDEQYVDMMLDNICGMIKDVNGETNKEFIREWLGSIKAADVNKIGGEVAKVSDWGVARTAEITCKDCGETVTIDVPTNPINFFT